jgi:hypothetical protein
MDAAELRAACAEKAALLAAAEERLARLEALHSMAQVPLVDSAPHAALCHCTQLRICDSKQDIASKWT